MAVALSQHFQKVRTLADIDFREARLCCEEYFSGGRCWDGLNRYSYCHNNPVRYTDPTGHGDGDGNSEGGSNFGNAGTNSGGYHGTNTTGADTTSTGTTGTGTVSTEGDTTTTTTTTTGGNGGGHTPGTTNGGHQPGTTSGGPSPGTTSGGPDDSKPKDPAQASGAPAVVLGLALERAGMTVPSLLAAAVFAAMDIFFFGVQDQLMTPEQLLSKANMPEQPNPEADNAKPNEKEQPASEEAAKKMADQIQKDLGVKAAEDFHEAKEGRKDRTMQQLREDAAEVYADHGKIPPRWMRP